MQPKPNQFFHSGNVSQSWVTVSLTLSDSGQFVECRASTPGLSGSNMSAVWKIEVLHPPHVTLSLGGTHPQGRVRVGEHLYLECGVEARPPVTKVWWSKGGVRLEQGDGLVMVGLSVAIQEGGR